MEEWPLKNEVVRVFQIMNRIYYERKINIGNKQTNQAYEEVVPEMEQIPSPSGNIRNLIRSTYSPSNISSNNTNGLGEYFVERDLHRLRHWEGDIVWQGRSGQSIRLGSSFLDSRVHIGKFKSNETDQSATIILTAGIKGDNPTPNNDFGRVVEDFNKDASSVWIAEDIEIIPEISTEDARSFRRVSSFPAEIRGNLIGLNTGTFFLNTKEAGIYISSEEDISLASNSSITMETDRRLDTYSVRATTMRSRDRISLMGPRIFIGSVNDTTQPLVLGEELNSLLIQLIQAMLTSAPTHVLTAMGPGVLNPQVVAALTQILTILQTRRILSSDNYVNRNNQPVG